MPLFEKCNLVLACLRLLLVLLVLLLLPRPTCRS